MAALAPGAPIIVNQAWEQETALSSSPPSGQPQRIWRINAYLILMAGVLVIVALGWLLSNALWNRLRPHDVRNVVAAGSDDAPRHERLTYRLRNAQGAVVTLDVLSDQRIDTFSSSKTSSDVLRNQMFVRVDDASSTWLFPTQQHLISRVWVVRGKEVTTPYQEESRTQPEQQPTRARLYEVVTRDTNQDGRLTERDHKSLFLARADGTGLATLAEGVTRLDGVALSPPDEIRAVATQADGTSRLLRFDLQRWTALPTLALPSLQEK